MWYRVDAVDRICEVSPDWFATAKRGNAAGLLPETVIGRPIWSFIDGEKVCFLYANVFETVRQTGTVATLRLRDDGHGRQALLEMQIAPARKQGLRITLNTIRERAVRISPLWNWSLQRSSELVIACSWCKHLQINQKWLPLDAAEALQPHLASPCPPQVVHHVCPGCEAAMLRERHLAFA